MPDSNDIVLCALADLQDPGSKSVTVNCEARLYELFVVRFGREIRAYLNNCPHTGGPLDWVPDQFLDIDRKHIQCATHAALFRWRDGHCLAGPCAGEGLTPVPAIIRDEQVLLLWEEFCAERATMAP